MPGLETPEIGIARVEATEPQIRVRIAHASTVKDGWRLSETTVEWSGSGEIPWEELRYAGHKAYLIGAGEAAERNASEAKVALA